ncbi:cellulase family glycosylhydrolase [Altererythrobacter salegens]|uniref:Cellulase family glycosylhydrolase n=1 Tax=Croceibacterium salegens TaxID=1737568 RepID=A0A6I4SWD7_9SPHN|nr:glycoside hydrolase family 5 protein [Croceibacterium salegens]MXO60153.1 cellulase family glycosylhydrolase [Croceibacterium salegens]
MPALALLAGLPSAANAREDLDLAGVFTPAPAAVPRVGPALALDKCVNLSNMFDTPPDRSYWGREFEDADIARIASKGFTAIRLPVRFNAHALEVPPYTIDPVFMDRIAQVVSLATARDLKVIVDLHHYIELDEDPAGQAPRFAALWRQVAERFADALDSVVFELMNEPHDKFGADNLLSVLEPALAEVRKTNPTRIVVIDGPDWAGLDAMLTSPFPDDPYVVPTFHYYSPVNFGFDKAPWLKPNSRNDFGRPEDLALIRADLAKVQDYMTRTGRVPFVGEYGAWERRPLQAREEFYETLSEAFASIGVDSCAWGYTNTMHLWDDKSGWVGQIADRIAAPLRN